MIDVVVDQGSLSLADSLLDRMKLLGKIEARSPFLKHRNHAAEMALGPFQPFDNVGMGFMNVIVCHANIISPWGG